MRLRSLFRDATIYAIAPQLVRFANLLVLPFVTPFLTSYDYGVLGIVGAYTAALSGLKDLGLTHVLTNSFFKLGRRHAFVWGRLWGVLLLWSLPYSVAVGIVAWIVLPAAESTKLPWVLLCVVAPAVFFECTSGLGQLHLQLERRAAQAATIGVLGGLLALGTSLLAVAHFRLGYLGFLIAGAISHTSVGLIYGATLLKEGLTPQLGISWGWLRRKLKCSLPIVPHYYAGYLLNVSDRAVMDLLKVPTGQIGQYVFGYTLGAHYGRVGQAFGTAATPWLWQEYGKGTTECQARVRDLLALVQVLMLGGAVLLALWMREFFHLVARSPTLAEAHWVASAVLISYAYHSTYYAAISKLRYHNRTRVFWKISLVGGVLNVALNLLLVPFLGIAGAVCATFAGYMWLAFAGYFVKDFKEVSEVDHSPALWFGAFAVAFAIALGAPHLNVAVRACISGAVLLVLLSSLLRWRARSRRQDQGA